jgi:hypothetical protein
MLKEKKEQITNLQMVEIDHKRFAVEMKDGELRANLTQMAKPFGTDPKQWLRTDEAKDYLKRLATAGKCSTADLLIVKRGGTPNEQGTWANDYRIAMRFAQWLSPEFSIMVDDMLVRLMTGDIKTPKQLTETMSGYSENTVITVKMGITVNQIYITGGIVYAKFSPIMRYLGYTSNNNTQYIKRIGRLRFIQVECGKQPAWFIDIDGFNELLKMTTMQLSSHEVSSIYRDVYGIETPPEKEAPFTYRFTDSEMLSVIFELNRKPVHKDKVMDLLLTGKK